ncbi:hypothetical protein ACROYT_G007404 [Oculina patagonica]
MLMNVLASGVLFLFIGPFKHVSAGETKEAGQVKSWQDVYIAVNDTLELNCSIDGTIHNIHPTQLAWKHDSEWVLNFTHIVNNNTVQLRKNHMHYEDAGVYECGLVNNSKFQSAQSFTVVVGEKPLGINRHQYNVKVYGNPVQEVTVEWPAQQANVTYELIVGRVPAGDMFCEFRNASQCKRTARYQNEMLSCYMGMDVLGKLFRRGELIYGGNCTAGASRRRCDIFCAKVIVKNAFGTSESDQAHWNLDHESKCPPVRNLSVSLGDNVTTVSWQRPRLVEGAGRLIYYVTYVITPILTGKRLPSKSFETKGKCYTINCTEYVSIKDPIVPFARYSFSARCNLYVQAKEAGPAVYTEVTSKQAAPSEAPHSCEVKNRSRHDAFVSWKASSIDTWNGIPRKFLVYYDNHSVVVNTSLDELQPRTNRSATPGTMLTNLDPLKRYTVNVAMCTGGDCGKFSQCLIPEMVTEEDSTAKVVTSPDKTDNAGVTIWIAIAIGVFFGLSLVAFIARSIRRKRARRKQQGSLIDRLGPLNGNHPYENYLDDRPSYCEDGQEYDCIQPTAYRPLLNDMGLRVTKM